nr:MAG TPA: hypothetical protein [Caudoviricetes sp.]DAU92463.1 MAG TPA: hypothetical protein [Caudoviricetes sp.]
MYFLLNIIMIILLYMDIFSFQKKYSYGDLFAS